MLIFSMSSQRKWVSFNCKGHSAASNLRATFPTANWDCRGSTSPVIYMLCVPKLYSVLGQLTAGWSDLLPWFQLWFLSQHQDPVSNWFQTRRIHTKTHHHPSQRIYFLKSKYHSHSVIKTRKPDTTLAIPSFLPSFLLSPPSSSFLSCFFLLK